MTPHSNDKQPNPAHRLIRLSGGQIFQMNTSGDSLAPDEGRSILEALVCETHEAALCSAVVGSWANALHDHARPDALDRIAGEMPQPPGLYLTLERWRSETGLPPAALISIDGFLKTVSAAKRQTRLVEADTAAIGWDRARLLHGLILSDAWRRTAGGAIEALSPLEAVASEMLAPCYGQSSRILRTLLEEVRLGRSPCLAEGGRIRRPHLPHQRRSVRKSLCEQAHLIVRSPRGANRSFPVFARDISVGGIGLERTPHLPSNTRVTVELAHGRLIPGITAWAARDKVGVRFDTPLSLNDPLLAG